MMKKKSYNFSYYLEEVQRALALYKETKYEPLLDYALEILEKLIKIREKTITKEELSFVYAEVDMFIDDLKQEAKKKGFKFIGKGLDKIKDEYKSIIDNDVYKAFKHLVTLSFLFDRAKKLVVVKYKGITTVEGDIEDYRANVFSYWKKKRAKEKKAKKQNKK